VDIARAVPELTIQERGRRIKPLLLKNMSVPKKDPVPSSISEAFDSPGGTIHRRRGPKSTGTNCSYFKGDWVSALQHCRSSCCNAVSQSLLMQEQSEPVDLPPATSLDSTPQVASTSKVVYGTESSLHTIMLFKDGLVKRPLQRRTDGLCLSVMYPAFVASNTTHNQTNAESKDASYALHGQTTG
jgi:hypothetical protein